MPEINKPELTKEERAAKRAARIERRVNQVLDKQDTAALVTGLTNLYASISGEQVPAAHARAYELVARQLEARHPEILPVIDRWYAEIGQVNPGIQQPDIYVAALTELALLDNSRPVKENDTNAHKSN
jgi:hypothetical protein